MSTIDKPATVHRMEPWLEEMEVSYRDAPMIAQSDLKAAWNNPQLYEEVAILKTRERSPATAAQQWGTRLESYLRERGSTDALEIIPKDVLTANGHKRGKRWEAYRDQFPPDTTLVTAQEYADQYAGFEAALSNVYGHKFASKLLYSACNEWSTRWMWEDGRETYKAELDIVDTTNKVIVDIKSAVETSPTEFARSVIKFGYDIQAAHYLSAVRRLGGAWLFAWVVIKNKPPYNVEVYVPSDDMLAYGEERLLERILYFQRCKSSGVWRTPTHDDIARIDLPNHIRRRMEYERLSDD